MSLVHSARLDWHELYAQEPDVLNRIRGLLAEFGLAFAQRPRRLRQALPLVLDDTSNGLWRR